MKLIADENTNILILGTYPGKQALDNKQYYFNSGNQFWNLFNIDKDLSYNKKIEKLLKLNIGIWDVCKSVKRKDSLDKNIKEIFLNDFSVIKKRRKKVETIYFNGKRAEKFGKKEIEKLGFKTVLLLSSSGANNKRLKERKRQWVKIK